MSEKITDNPSMTYNFFPFFHHSPNCQPMIELTFELATGIALLLLIYWLLSLKKREQNRANKMLEINNHLESKIAERAKQLETESLRFKFLLEMACDGIYIINDLGQIVFYSESFANMLGYNREQMDTLNERDWCVDYQEDNLSKRVESEGKDFLSKTITFESKHRCKNGSIIETDIVACKIILEGTTYFYASSRNISCRKQAQAALKAQSEQLQQVNRELQIFKQAIDNVPSYVYIKDLQHKILYGNKQVITLFKVTSQQELQQINVDHFLSPESAELIRQMDKKVFGGNSTQEELVLIPKTAESFANCKKNQIFLDTRIPLYDDSAKIIGLFGVSTDITERKHLESELQLRNEQLEEFSYVAAHDMREPLRTISGLTSLIMEKCTQKFDEQQLQLLSMILQSADGLNHMLNNLVQYSILNKSKLRDEKSVIDSKDVMKEAIRNLDTLIKENNVTVSHCDLPTINANKMELLQVFQNLLSNAVKFRCEHNPRVVVSYKKVQFIDGKLIDCSDEDKTSPSYLLFSFKDNGRGIKKDHQDKVFIPFRKFGYEFRSKYRGSGLGLSIVKKIVELNGGNIWFESEEGVGTTFFFTWNIGQSN